MESIQSSTSVESDESDESLEETKEELEYNPTTWEILKLCGPEKWLMVAGVVAAIAVGSSFPTFAILFGETYGVCPISVITFIRKSLFILFFFFTTWFVFTSS